jgi:hypothetical protein
MSTEKIIEVMAKAMMVYAKTLPPASSFHCLLRSHRLECANAALTALQSSGYMVIEGWKPIETAPEMKGVLIFGRTPPTEYGFENWRMGSGHYHDVMKRWIWEGEQVLSHWVTKPTHWMPLPPPPQAQGEIEERSDTDGAEQPGSGLTQNKTEAPNG